MTELTWSQVVERPTDRLEFGACHVNYAWRRHKTPQTKFQGLVAAFKTSDDRIQRLLQAVDSNYNARNHPERGQALYAAVWYPNSSWAILCNATHATLVPRDAIEAFVEERERNDETVNRLRILFDASDRSIRRVLDDSFYDCVLRSQ